MSYDITFKVKVENKDVYVSVGDCFANITWNVGRMIRKATGLEWNNCESNGLCTDVMPHIEHGLRELVVNPEKYKECEAPNGWGTVGNCRHFFETILTDWENFKRDFPELVDVVTFWIE